MFFGMTTHRDPMAELRAFVERSEAARNRPMTAAEAQRVVEGEFGTGRRSPQPRPVATRQDMDRENRERYAVLPRRAANEHVPANTVPRTQTPTPYQRAFLKEQLARRGLPTSQIDGLQFVSGLDSTANLLTRTAFNSGVNAVTQGSIVYVRPDRFEEVAGFHSPAGFEEAYHTAQFALDDSFYPTYGILSLGGLLAAGDAYDGNAYEAFAHGASRQMYDEYQSSLYRR